LTAVASLDARRLVETCISEHFPERAGAFEVRADMDGLRIRGDGRKLERVFLNLFRNAFEAGAARIRIHLTALGNRPLILVEDDGKGCPEAELGMLFQRNFTTKSGSGGSGIGLHLAEATLEAHGGAIRAVSKNGWPADAEAMARRRPDCDARPAPMASEGHWDTGMIFCLEFPVASI
jgi:signal transduction histidine kinase